MAFLSPNPGRGRPRDRKPRDGHVLLQDAMRVELELNQKRFVAEAFGSEHPLVRLQDFRTTDARNRLSVQESRQAVRDVGRAVVARRAEVAADAKMRAAVGDAAAELVDELAAAKDDLEDLRAVFTSSYTDDA